MGAAARFQQLARKLRAVDAGGPTQRAAARVAPEILAVARQALAGHQRSGNAASVLAVEVTPRGVALRFPRYLSFHPWWPFRDGMPPELEARCQDLLAEEVRATLRG